MNKFILGNWLRGFFQGCFISENEAWTYLSKRFLLSYPSKEGRYVLMYIVETNKYGFEQPLLCREGITQISKIIPSKDDVLSRCKASTFRG